MENGSRPSATSRAIGEIINDFIELFAAQIHAFPEMEELMNSSSSLERHNELMREHLEKTYSDISAIDAFELSSKVGQSHIDHEVRLSWYLITYNKIFESYHTAQTNAEAELPELDEFRAIWLRDAGDTLDSYYELLIQQHARESRRLQQSIDELDVQAKTDPLTEILNRRGFRSEVDKSTLPGLFILLDLDNFKAINDLQGHVVGDEILKKVAETLANQLRQDDLIGRIGGDEFALWLPSQNEMTSGEVRQVAERVLSTFAFSKWSIGISGGIVLRPAEGESFDELYSKADRALYQAKLNGGYSLMTYGGNEMIDLRPKA